MCDVFLINVFLDFSFSFIFLENPRTHHPTYYQPDRIPERNIISLII